GVVCHDRWRLADCKTIVRAVARPGELRRKRWPENQPVPVERGRGAPVTHGAPRDVAARRRAFRSLHARPGLFVMPNPWDVGTARILAALGFEALAASSAALARS